MNTTPQYMKTSADEVLEAMGEVQASYSVFLEYAKNENYRLTGEEEESHIFTLGDPWTGCAIVGVRARFADQLPGQWKKPDHGCVMPFKNNPIREEWKAHSHPYMPIPGRREVEWGERRMGPGTLFVQDGVAYSGYGFIPRDPAPEGNELWEEIRASEFMAAMEAYNDEIEKERNDE